jgi:hypothetical protein
MLTYKIQTFKPSIVRLSLSKLHQGHISRTLRQAQCDIALYDN